MNYDIFKNLYFNQNFGENLLIYLIILLTMIIFLKSEIKSLFDPLILSFTIPIANVLAILIWLYQNNYMNNNDFYGLLAMNLIVVLGFKIFSKLMKKETVSSVEKYGLFKIFYTIHTIFFMLVCINFIINFGLLGLHDKLAIYRNNGILVYLNLLFIPGQIILFFIKKIIYSKVNKFDYIFLILNFIVQILNGGKATVLSIFSFLIINYILINEGVGSLNREKINKIKKMMYKIIVASILGVFFMFGIVNKTNNIYEITDKIIFRIMAYGDIYYLAYPNDIITKIPEFSFVKFYFLSIVNPLRKIFNFQLSPTLGFEVIKKVYNIENPWFGPNARFDVILQLTVGNILGILISLLFAFMLAWTRKKIILKKSFIGIYFQIYFYFLVFDIFTDYSMFANKLLPLITLIPILYLVSLFLYTNLKRRIRNE